MAKHKTPSFWWKTAADAPAWTKPLGWLYGRITRLRYDYMYKQESFLPIICVGNFVAGGAGKTPTTIAFCELVRKIGLKPVIVSRGYGGKLRGPALINPKKHSAVDVGDEPLLLAQFAPTIIAKNRAAGAEFAISYGNVVIMDDGLQNPTLFRNLSLAVVDGAVGDGNGLCVPAGPLRAPLKNQMKWVDGILIINNSAKTDHLHDVAWEFNKPLFLAHTKPSANYAQLKDRQVLLYTGLGRPEKVKDMLKQFGAVVSDFAAFPDHYNFTEVDAIELLRRAKVKGLILTTTSKDHVRLLGQGGKREELAEKSVVLDVDITFDNPNQILTWLEEGLGKVKE